MTYNFLLIGNPKSAWRKCLNEAISPLGDLRTISEEESRSFTLGAIYNVIIVDATEVQQVEEVVTKFSSQLNPPYVIVASAAPSWPDTLKAFRAGATDCIRKYNEKDKLARFFSEFLAGPALVSNF